MQIIILDNDDNKIATFDNIDHGINLRDLKDLLFQKYGYDHKDYNYFDQIKNTILLDHDPIGYYYIEKITLVQKSAYDTMVSGPECHICYEKNLLNCMSLVCNKRKKISSYHPRCLNEHFKDQKIKKCPVCGINQMVGNQCQENPMVDRLTANMLAGFINAFTKSLVETMAKELQPLIEHNNSAIGSFEQQFQNFSKPRYLKYKQDEKPQLVKENPKSETNQCKICFEKPEWDINSSDMASTTLS